MAANGEIYCRSEHKQLCKFIIKSKKRTSPAKSTAAGDVYLVWNILNAPSIYSNYIITHLFQFVKCFFNFIDKSCRI